MEDKVTRSDKGLDKRYLKVSVDAFVGEVKRNIHYFMEDFALKRLDLD